MNRVRLAGTRIMRSFFATCIAFVAAAGWLLATARFSAAAPEEPNPNPGIAELPAWTASDKLTVRSLVLDSIAIGRYEPQEATLDLAATYDNPFDPADVEVRGRLTTPSGRAVEVDGFFYQPYRRRTGVDDSQTPLLDAAEPSCWKIRFTPTEMGRHTLLATVRDRSGQVETKPVEFQVVDSVQPGFVRVSPRHGRYFEFDDGTTFFPVGQNLQNDWPVLSHLQPLAKAGCNAVRPFLFCHWTWLEWSPRPSNPRIWQIPEIAFTQTHNYDGAATIRDRAGQMLALSPKPHIVGEGGGPPGADVDPEGIEFHNCLWAGALSGAAGATLPWHWRERIEPRQLFFHYTAIERFAGRVPWIAEKLTPVPQGNWTVSIPDGQPGFSPVLVVPLGPNWGRKATRNEFRVEPDGSVSHLDEMSTSLYGSVRSEWANPPTLDVDYPADGRFIVHVEAASHAVLEIVMDGKTVLRDESLNKPRDYIRKDFGIDVPAGRHRITLRNAGADWIGLGHLLLANYRDARCFPDVEVHAVASPRYAASWFHHRVNQWAFRNAGFPPQPITAAVTEVRGLADGAYRAEWWDTYQGRVSKSEQVVSRDHVLRLTLPPFSSDVACLVHREWWDKLPACHCRRQARCRSHGDHPGGLGR